MKNPSVNSIVERRKTFNKWFVDNHADPDGKFTHMPKWLKADLRKAWDAATAEAATIISELQGRVSDLEVDLGNAKHSNNLMDEEMGEWKARALAAESSLAELQAERDEARRESAHRLACWKDVVKKWNAAESSLSRIKEETIEECAKVAGRARQEFASLAAEISEQEAKSTALICMQAASEIQSAIRSLGSTGGAKKTAESGHSDSSVNSRTE